MFPAALTDEGRAHGIFAGDAKTVTELPPVLSVFSGAQPTPGPTAAAGPG